MDEKRLAEEIIARCNVAVMACNQEGAPHSWAVFLVFDDGKLYFKSLRSSSHILSLQKDSRCAATIFDPASQATAKYGVQLKGKFREIIDSKEMEWIIGLHTTKFAKPGRVPDSMESLLKGETIASYYCFEPTEFKLVIEDEVVNHHSQTYLVW